MQLAPHEPHVLAMPSPRHASEEELRAAALPAIHPARRMCWTTYSAPARVSLET